MFFSVWNCVGVWLTVKILGFCIAFCESSPVVVFIYAVYDEIHEEF